MAVDTYKDSLSSLASPARKAAAVVPDDGVDLTVTTRSIYVGVAGDVVVHMVGAIGPVTFKSVAAGILPIRVDRILATGTTAASIVALW